jgi:hypothetical protein
VGPLMSALGQKQTFAAQKIICFASESGHLQRDSPCLLWAISGRTRELVDLRHVTHVHIACPGRRTGFDSYVLAIHPAQLFQRLKKSCVAGALFRIVIGHKHGNPPHPLARLCLRHERPCSRNASQR